MSYRATSGCRCGASGVDAPLEAPASNRTAGALGRCPLVDIALDGTLGAQALAADVTLLAGTSREVTAPDVGARDVTSGSVASTRGGHDSRARGFVFALVVVAAACTAGDAERAKREVGNADASAVTTRFDQRRDSFSINDPPPPLRLCEGQYA